MDKTMFVNEVIDTYRRAREVRTSRSVPPNDRIRRGRSHTVASEVEDLLACHLLDAFPDLDKILVDQPITFRAENRSRTRYLDLVLVCGGEIVLLIEVKMDLNRKRDGVRDIVERASAIVSAVRGRTVKYRDGITKEQQEIRVSHELVHQIVVVSKVGLNPARLQEQLDEVDANFSNDSVRYYFLTDGAHPNTQDSAKAKDEITVLSDFDAFIRDIGTHLNGGL